MFRKFSLATISILAILFVANTFCLAQPPQTQPQSLLTRHVRDIVVNGQAPLVGHLPANQVLQFDIVMQLRDRAGLQSFIREQYDPSSPHFHKFLTPQEVTERYGPSQEDWDALVAFAKANGFQIVGGTRDSRDLWLTGTVANIEKALHVTMGVYQDPSEEGRTFFATDREPTVDLPFQLWHITGLDDNSKPHPLYVKKSDYAKAHGMNPEDIVSNITGSGPSGNFLGSDMRAAYYGGSLTGTGQNIGLFELAGSDLADLSTYYTNVGQTEPYTPTLVSTGGYGTACLDSGSSKCDDIEQTIDMQQAMGMAPGSNMLYMYVCGAVLANGTGNFSDSACISAMVTTTAAPLSKQIGCSWGWTPADTSTLDPYFEQMASQGQNFFVASGDSSTWSASNEAWPADDANVVAVGGTDLSTSSAGGPWSSETAWSDSGGGISPDSIAIPSWQQISGVINSSNKGSTSLRNGPDVSANGNFSFYYCGDQKACGTGLGGTSFAAPMWAGYLALANQQAAANSESIGFINPTIYTQAAQGGTNYSSIFHDITSGTSGSYSAVTGYDLVTGWGSPNGSGLINLLAPVAGGTESQTITFTTNAPASAAYNSQFTVAATASSGLTVTFTSSGSCSNSGATYTMTSGAGTCSVIANQAGNSTYAAAPTVTQTTSATTAGQTITFSTNAPASAAYNSHFTVAASASSGLAVAYTSSGSCSNSGATYTMTSGTGTCSVIANQAGNTNYSAAPTVTQNTSATTASQTITFSTNAPASAAYGTSFTVAASASSGLAVAYTSSGSCSNSGATYTMTSGTGSCSVIANQAGNSNYSAAPTVTQTTNATKAATSISVSSVNPASEAYGQDATVTITAVLSWSGSGAAPTAGNVTVHGNGPSSYGTTSCGSPSGTTMTCTNTYTPSVSDAPGSYTESAAFSGDGNYSNSGSTQTNNFTISSATSGTTVTSSQNPSVLNQSVTFTATINGEYGLLKGRREHVKRNVTGSVTWSSNTGCGTTNVTSGNPGIATCTTSSLPVGTDTITATYSGDSSHSGSTGTLSGGQVVGSTTTTAISVTNVSPAAEDYGNNGTIQITAVLSWTGNGPAPTAGNVTIGGNGPSGTYGTTSCGAASGDTMTCMNTYTPTSSDTPGNYTESAAFSGDSNYSASSSNQTNNFTINSATSSTAVSSSQNPSNWGQSVTFTATISGEFGLVKGRNGRVKKNVTGSVTWSANTGCGTTSVTSGNPGVATCTTSSLPAETNTITATYSGDSNHGKSTGTLSGGQVVNPASQAITFTTNAPSSAVYNTTFSVAATGGASGNPVVFTSSGACSNSGATYTMTSGTGTCSVIANQAGNTDYSAAPQVTQSVNANTASQTITFTTNAPASAAYNSNFTVAAGASSGLAVAYSSSGACSNSGATYTMTSGTGTCSVIASQAGNNNYSAATPVSQTTNATKASQSITFTANAPSSAAYNSNFTVAASASSGQPVAFTSSGSCSNSSATYTMTSGTGTCSVIANQAGNGNYNAATQVTQSTNATPASQTITVTTPAPPTATLKSSFTVAASAGSGQPVAYGSSGGCTNSGATYTMASTGKVSCVVTMNQAGNSNYSAAPQVTETVKVAAAIACGSMCTFTGAPGSATYLSTFNVATASGSDSSVPDHHRGRGLHRQRQHRDDDQGHRDLHSHRYLGSERCLCQSDCQTNHNCRAGSEHNHHHLNQSQSVHPGTEGDD